MKKLGTWAAGVAAVAALCGVFAVGASSAIPTNYSCNGTLASGTYLSITVPDGATCDGTNATIRVLSGVSVGSGATFILGQEGGPSTGTINGGVRANGAASLQLHLARVNGGVSLQGGNGFFSTVEDNSINGGVTISGYTGFWLGFIRNNVNGQVTINNNTLGDPDANEFVTNRINGSFVCHGNSPAPQVGDSMGQPNAVNGQKVDQCAAPGL